MRTSMDKSMDKSKDKAKTNSLLNDFHSTILDSPCFSYQLNYAHLGQCFHSLKIRFLRNRP